MDFALKYCRHLLPVLQQLQCILVLSIATLLQVSLFLLSAIIVSVLHFFTVPGCISGLTKFL